MTTVHDFQSAADFLRAMRPESSVLGEGKWVYRGQQDASWPLRPSLSRPEPFRAASGLWKSHAALAENDFRSYQVDWWGNDLLRQQLALDTYTRLLVQASMLDSFTRLADELGFAVGSEFPYGVPDVRLRLSQHGGIPSWSFQPTPLLALAQHQGIPTLLLDWSWKPQVAAWFGAEVEASSSSHLAVWALDLNTIGRNLAPYFCPRFTVGFLHAQHGLFVHLRSPFSTVDSMGEWPAFEDVEEGSKFVLLRLPTTEAPHLRALLRGERFTLAHLKPTLENVRASLGEEWR